jgi:DNA repair protein SbcC/Rad50
VRFNSLGLKNFRSFGNNYQELKLGSVGLTALVGKNGSGKTSLAEAIEFAIYGKVRGRKKKQTNKATLANRHNKNLSVTLRFNEDTVVNRCSQPDSLEIKKNGVDASNDLKTEVLKMPDELFANFVSFNSKDFKDFLHLSKHDRDSLMDRLFNLRAFEELQQYVEKLHEDNLKMLQEVQTTHDKYEHSMQRLLKKMQEVKEKRKDRNDVKVEELEGKLQSLKPEFESLQESLTKIADLKKHFNEKWQKLQTGSTKASLMLKDIVEKLELYETDRCLTCGSPLDTPNHISVKEELLLKKAKIESTIVLGKQMIATLKEDARNQTQSEGDLNTKLIEIKSEILSIKKQKTELSSVTETEEDKDWSEEIKQLGEKATDLRVKMEKASRLNEAYNCLLSILDVDVNRQELLTDLVPKLNYEIFKNVQRVGMPFMLRFNNDLSCEIEQLGIKIDEDSLSEGEAACLNTACLLAFMKLSKISKYTNLVFMDEVFEKLDEDNVQTLLNMIRNYAKDEGLEIFLVQQRQMTEECFDRVIKVEKKMMFSYITQQ